MDSPSPIAYNNPLYSGPGDDSFLDSSTDNFMVTNICDVLLHSLLCLCVCSQTNPIYDDVDDEM